MAIIKLNFTYGGVMAEKIVKDTLVELPSDTTLGLGKVLRISGNKVYVFFINQKKKEASIFNLDNNQLVVAAVQSDPILDNLPTFEAPNGKLTLPGKSSRWTLEQITREFNTRYPLGFNDPAYLGDKGERKFKWVAHEKFIETIGNGQGQKLLAEGNIPELTHRILAVVSKSHMFLSFEMMALTDALQNNEAAGRFFTALFAVLDAPDITEVVYQPYIDSVLDLPQEDGKAKVATWPVVTLLPFLAQPDRHMFLKPTNSKSAAEALAFNLHYEPLPNWKTYKALLEMGKIYMSKISHLEPRDLLDVQSFLWLAGHE